MRILFSIFILIAGLSCAQAQSPRIDHVDQVQPGILSVGKFKTIEDGNISTGTRSTATGVKIERATKEIPAVRDTVFGIRFRLVGSPKNAKVPIRVVWRYPQPGIKNPETGTTKLVDDYVSQQTIGTVDYLYWNLANDYTLVPGTWTLELWRGERKLVAQDFLLSKP